MAGGWIISLATPHAITKIDDSTLTSEIPGKRPISTLLYSKDGWSQVINIFTLKEKHSGFYLKCEMITYTISKAITQ